MGVDCGVIMTQSTFHNNNCFDQLFTRYLHNNI